MKHIIDFALKSGADHVEMLHVFGTSTHVSVLNGILESHEQTTSDAVGLRVIVGQRQAACKTSNLSETGLKRLANQAISMAKASPEAPDLVYNEAVVDTLPQCHLADEATPSHSALTALATQAEAAALATQKAHPLKSSGFWGSASRNHSVYITSHGHHLSHTGTMYNIGGEIIAGDRDMTSGYDYHSCRFFDALKSTSEIAEKAVQKASEKQGSVSMNLGNVPVLFDREIAGSLVGELLSAINGNNIVNGLSFLKNDLKKQLFNEDITIVDDPLIDKGIASRVFDGEGFIPEKLNLIENGVLTHFLLDMRSAKKLGMTTNHRASRGLGGLPAPSSTNTYLMAGKNSRQSFINSMDTGFVVTGLKGRGGQLENGEYSVGAEGFLVENGIVTKPLSAVTLGGHLRDIFKTMVPADDLVFEYGTNAPSIYIPQLTVAGK